MRRVELNDALASIHCTGRLQHLRSQGSSGGKLWKEASPPAEPRHQTQRGVCSLGVLQAQRQILYPKNCSCCSSAGSDMAILSLPHTQFGRQGWPPPLSRVETSPPAVRRGIAPCFNPKASTHTAWKAEQSGPRHLVPESGWVA